MQIIFLNRFFYPDHSATSQMLSDLAFGLSEQTEDEVTVITSRQLYDNAEARLPPRETCKGVKVLRIATPTFGRGNLIGRLFDYLGFYFSATSALLRIADHDSIVVVKTDPPLISIPCALVCRLKGAKMVNWLQDLFPEVAINLGIKAVQGAPGRLLQRLRNRSLHRADMNIAISSGMRQQLLQQGIPDEQITVIHNWANGDAITPVAMDANALRESWGLSDKFVVGYSGNLGRAHEFDTLLGAAERLRGRNDILFLFIGGGALSARIQAAAEQKQLTNLLFKPYQPRDMLRMSLAVADVHIAILRPEFEGLVVPSKFYGVAAAGRPMVFIGDPQGDIPSILQDAQCGETVAIGDSLGLADTLNSLQRDHARRQQMGSNARAVFDECYATDKVYNHWQAVLVRLKTDKPKAC